MAALFFGQWLVHRGCITPEQLLSALDIQLATNRDLGAFAIDARILDRQQVDQIHVEQREHDRRFGHIAIEKGLLTTEQVDRLLERQRGLRRYLGEILVEEGWITHKKAMTELEMFLAEKRAADSTQEIDIGAFVTETSDTEAYLSACVTMFERVAKQKLRLIRMEDGARPEQAYTVMQIIDAETNAYIALSLPEGEVLHIAHSIAGRPFDVVNQTVLESAKEMLNVIMGNVAGWLSVDGTHFNPQPPEMVVDNTGLPRAEQNVTYFLSSAQHPLQLIIGR